MRNKKTILISALAFLFAFNGQAQQLYNMDFDHWSKSSGSWNPYPKGAGSNQLVWDTANRGLSVLGINGTVPEYDHVAVPGEGKAAAKIVSRKVVWAFVAGNLFTGRFICVVDLSGAEIDFGVPFSARPKSLSGYVHYIPKKIDYAKEPYLGKKGRLDEGYVEVVLTDWDKPEHVVTSEGDFLDWKADPHVIGRAVLNLTKETDGYIPFEIPIEYLDGRTPKYVVITAASSRYGAYFTGGTGSTLYVDEFRFNY